MPRKLEEDLRSVWEEWSTPHDYGLWHETKTPTVLSTAEEATGIAPPPPEPAVEPISTAPLEGGGARSEADLEEKVSAERAEARRKSVNGSSGYIARGRSLTRTPSKPSRAASFKETSAHIAEAVAAAAAVKAEAKAAKVAKAGGGSHSSSSSSSSSSRSTTAFHDEHLPIEIRLQRAQGAVQLLPQVIAMLSDEAERKGAQKVLKEAQQFLKEHAPSTETAPSGLGKKKRKKKESVK